MYLNIFNDQHNNNHYTIICHLFCLVPGKVMMFEVQERGSHHFVVGWEPPTEPNGILLGYNLGHRPGE